ncbi:MAG: MFS transporter [Candidatus Hodarchaeota archaeon]
MYQWLQKKLEIAEMNPKSQLIAMKFLSLQLSRIAQGALVSTFLVLFLLEIISFAELGLLLAIQLALTALLDYPTGAFSDWTSQRFVMILAYCSYAVSILFLLAGTDFYSLLLFVIWLSIGRSQESGALETWFDKNYRATSGAFDKDRKMYGAFYGKLIAYQTVINVFAFILGGLIAAIFSRRVLFYVQFLLVLLVLTLVVILMKDSPSLEKSSKPTEGFGSQFMGGLKFVSASKANLCFFVGLAMISASIGPWFYLMLFPFYQGYAGSDEYIGLLRAIINCSGVFWRFAGARFSKRIGKQNLHRCFFIDNFMIYVIFFLAVFGFYTLLPPTNTLTFVFLGVILLFVLFLHPWASVEGILRQRLVVDLIPDEYRNSIYSLQSSLAVLVCVPFLIIGGGVISEFGFSMGILTTVAMGFVSCIVLGLGLYWLQKLAQERITAVEVVEKASLGTPT